MLPIAILAGGLATRLRPVTETVPKALIEVAGEPFLAHQLRLLQRHGFAVKVTKVVMLEVADRPGGLAAICGGRRPDRPGAERKRLQRCRRAVG